MTDSRIKIRPMTESEKVFLMENHELIKRFLKLEKKDMTEFYDVVVFGFIQSVEEYLTNEDLRKKYSFENVSYMYMRRSLFRHFRRVGTAGRKSNHGNDLPYEDTEDFLITEKNYAEDPFYNLEYLHMLETIKEKLTQEQQIILEGKIEGYSLKEIADINGIDLRRVYKQFAKVKNIVADTLDLDKAI